MKLRRSQQYAGINSDADIVGVEGLHLEVKRQEKMDMYGALDQAIRDAKDGDVPVVMHRKNRKPWVLIIEADNVLEFARTVIAAASGIPSYSIHPKPKESTPIKRRRRAVRVRPE